MQVQGVRERPNGPSTKRARGASKAGTKTFCSLFLFFRASGELSPILLGAGGAVPLRLATLVDCALLDEACGHEVETCLGVNAPCLHLQERTNVVRGYDPADPQFGSANLSWEHRQMIPLKLQEGAWVFPSKRTGTPPHPWSAQGRWLLRAGAKVGGGRLGWHAFRHTYSTLLNEYGTDVRFSRNCFGMRTSAPR